MAVVTPSTTAWSACPAGKVQVLGGRVMWASSNSPAADDWFVFGSKQVVDFGIAGYVRAIDAGARVVTMVTEPEPAPEV